MRLFLVLCLLFFTSVSAKAADMRFIQVDGALFDKANLPQFENLIEKINKEKDVEFVVFTGNNIAKPNPKLLGKFLETANNLKQPFYIVLGQKDVNRQKHLSKDDYVEIVRRNVKNHKKITSPNYVFTKKKLVFIVADGSKDLIPMSMGYYKDDVLEWLDAQLALNSDKNVIILQHYPIIPPSKRESHYTYKAEEYLKVLEKHKNVKAIVAGHFGVNHEQKINGIMHIATKEAPCYRIIDIIDYETENPTFWSTIKE